ncbi:MAG: zinc-ribbon domain-containing protein [Nitrospinota bacterium]
MDVICSSCSKKISVPDEKVPKGQTFSFTCPSCKHKITVSAGGGTASETEAPVGFTQMTDKPVAMLCHPKPEKYRQVLEEMGFELHTPEHHLEAVNSLRLTDYSLVLITKEFEDSPHSEGSILVTMQNMNMAERRNTFVIYVAPGIKSFDNMEAFALSVHLQISSEEMESSSIKTRIERAIEENDRRYKVFFEAMDTLGMR